MTEAQIMNVVVGGLGMLGGWLSAAAVRKPGLQNKLFAALIVGVVIAAEIGIGP